MVIGGRNALRCVLRQTGAIGSIYTPFDSLLLSDEPIFGIRDDVTLVSNPGSK
jgi:hypothetical protein